MNDLTGTVALVTGGSRGIGAAIATRLAADGADVAFTYLRDEASAHKITGEIEALGRRAIAIRADSAVADEVVGAVHRTATELGRLDILVNNAGIYPAGPFEAFTVEEVDRALHIHARAAFLAAQAAVGHMNEGGRIVGIGTNLSERALFGGLALYTLSKSALNGFTRALARELGPRGITVNLVQPGSTDTDMNPAAGAHAAGQLVFNPLGRFAAPEEVAAMVAFLAGPDGRAVNGAVLTVDSGINA